MKRVWVLLAVLVFCARPAFAVNEALVQQANEYYKRGSLLAEKNDHKKAIREFKDALSLNPNDAKIHFKLGVSYYETLKGDDAIEEYRAALRLDPKMSEIHFFLATTLNDQARTKEAIEEYRLAVASEPKNLDVLFDLGYALYKDKQYGEATDLFERFLREIPISYKERIKWTQDMLREMKQKRFSS